MSRTYDRYLSVKPTIGCWLISSYHPEVPKCGFYRINSIGLDRGLPAISLCQSRHTLGKDCEKSPDEDGWSASLKWLDCQSHFHPPFEIDCQPSVYGYSHFGLIAAGFTEALTLPQD